MVLSRHEIVEVPEQVLLAVELQVACADLSRKLGPALERVLSKALSRGASPGRVIVRRLADDGQTTHVSAGICVAEDTEGDETVRRTLLPKARTARATNVGPYDGLAEAHAELLAWAKGQGLTPAGPPWEVHLTDPGDEPDPARAEAQLYLPIKP